MSTQADCMGDVYTQTHTHVWMWAKQVIGLAAMFEEKIKEGKAADKAKGKAKA